MEKQIVEAMLELATTYEEANEIMEQHSGCKTYEEKIEYLIDMFDCRIVSRNVDDVEADYIALLTTVVDTNLGGHK